MTAEDTHSDNREVNPLAPAGLRLHLGCGSTVVAGWATFVSRHRAQVRRAASATRSRPQADRKREYGGGGLSATDAAVTLTGCTVKGNSAGFGGGLVDFGGTTTLTNTTVRDNRVGGPVASDAYGGGIFSEQGSLTLDEIRGWLAAHGLGLRGSE